MSAPRDYALAVWGRGLLLAGIAVAGILASAWLGRRFGAAGRRGRRCRRSCSSSSRSASTPSGRIRTSSPGWMPLARTALAGRSPRPRVRARRQALPEHRRCARPTGHSGARRDVPEPIHALCPDIPVAGGVRQVHRHRDTSALTRQPDVRRALRPCGDRTRDLAGARRRDSSAPATVAPGSTTTPAPIRERGSSTERTSSRTRMRRTRSSSDTVPRETRVPRRPVRSSTRGSRRDEWRQGGLGSAVAARSPG